MVNFCTLFDSYYLDKGIALYRSLERQTPDFCLYVFCFDDVSKKILKEMNLTHAVILSHEDIEQEEPELLRLKEERSKAEYCWTCTSVIISYVLRNFSVDHCIYIDADLFFFADPKVLLDEIQAAGAHTAIMEHRFTNSMRDQRLMRRSGKYCVEFNYFDQSEDSWKALNWWKDRCFEWCFHLYEPERMGDQKYLEKFPKLFNGVHEMQHLGGGVAPWNLKQYLYQRTENDQIILKQRNTGKEFPLIFYHFQNLRYLSINWVNVSSETHSVQIKNAIYIPYLKCLEQIRKDLATKNIYFSVKKTYSSNKLIALLQGTVLRFKVRSISDLYDLRKIREND